MKAIIKIIKGIWKIYKDYREEKAKMYELFKVGRMLIRMGLIDDHWLPGIGRYTIDVKTVDEMLEARERLRALPIIEDWELSSWSPHGKRVIFQWNYRKNKVAIWLTCTIDTIPEGLLSPGCSFVEEEQPKSYALVCKKEDK